MKAVAALTTAFAALATAAPSTSSENIDIGELLVRKNETADATDINAVYFKLNGTDATNLVCQASNPKFPSDVITCGESKYRFALYPGSDDYEFALRLYHELGVG